MLYGIPSLSREIIRRTSYTDSNASWNSELSGLNFFLVKMQKKKVIPSTILIQMKRDKETLKNDILQLLEVLLVLRPWTLLRKEPLDTCSEEPRKFRSLFQQYDHCLFILRPDKLWQDQRRTHLHQWSVLHTQSWFSKKKRACQTWQRCHFHGLHLYSMLHLWKASFNCNSLLSRPITCCEL